MRKFDAILIIAIAIVFATSSQSALAGKSTGKASPNLYKSTATGTHYKEATITMRKAGGDPKSTGKPIVTQKNATEGAGAGKAKFNEFTIKKTTDKASP